MLPSNRYIEDVQVGTRFRLSRHAVEEAERRGISLLVVERVVRHPEQIVAEYGGAKAYQSRLTNEDGTLSLVRVIVDDAVEPLTVITVYRTSKVAKYWREP